jgi:predicted ATPase
MRLVGRTAEVERLDRLLASARAGNSGALVLRGEPGIGKTTLLRYAIERARKMHVLEVRGLEAEAQLAFSGLSDLLTPILGQLEAVPEPQAAALLGALGLGPAAPADRFVVCVATLRLLAAAAERQPVLVAVDDSQWLDTASQEALFFAARRFEAERVAVVITARDTGEPTSPTGLDELMLSGLSLSAAAELLAERIPYPIPSNVTGRLFAATAAIRSGSSR